MKWRLKMDDPTPREQWKTDWPVMLIVAVLVVAIVVAAVAAVVISL